MAGLILDVTHPLYGPGTISVWNRRRIAEALYRRFVPLRKGSTNEAWRYVIGGFGWGSTVIIAKLNRWPDLRVDLGQEFDDITRNGELVTTAVTALIAAWEPHERIANVWRKLRGERTWQEYQLDLKRARGLKFKGDPA